MSKKTLTPILLPADPTAALEAATKQYVDAKSEVYIGAADPIATLPLTELWYDTDEPVTLPEDTRWQTAWGIVAMGSLLTLTTLPANTETQVTNSLPFTMMTGRRYRVVIRARAVNGTVASGMNTYLRDGTTKMWSSAAIPYIPLGGAGYNTATYDWIMSGDGVARSFNVACNPVAAGVNFYVESASYFYIEDVGPVTGAVAPLMSITDRWNTAWGEIYYSTLTTHNMPLSTTASNLGQFDLTGLTVGRKLQITMSSGCGPTVSAANSEMYFGIGDTSNNTWRFVRTFNPTSNTKAGPNQILTYRTTTTASTLSFRAQAWVSAGTGLYAYTTTSEPLTVLVEDIGPASGAVPIASPIPTWTNLTLLNSWGNYGGSFAPASYRKIGDEVQLRGLIANNTTIGAGLSSVIGTLPAECKPPFIKAMIGATGLPVSRIDVETNGNVLYQSLVTAAVSYCSLDLLRFSVTP